MLQAVVRWQPRSNKWARQLGLQEEQRESTNQLRDLTLWQGLYAYRSSEESMTFSFLSIHRSQIGEKTTQGQSTWPRHALQRKNARDVKMVDVTLWHTLYAVSSPTESKPTGTQTASLLSALSSSQLRDDVKGTGVEFTDLTLPRISVKCKEWLNKDERIYRKWNESNSTTTSCDF